MSTIDRTHTFDLDNQPGIRTHPVTRSELTSAIEALGLDPKRVIEIGMNGSLVRIKTTLVNSDGALVGAGVGGYVKHEYTLAVISDEEAMSPSEYYGRDDVQKAGKA